MSRHGRIFFNDWCPIKKAEWRFYRKSPRLGWEARTLLKIHSNNFLKPFINTYNFFSLASILRAKARSVPNYTFFFIPQERPMHTPKILTLWRPTQQNNFVVFVFMTFLEDFCNILIFNALSFFHHILIPSKRPVSSYDWATIGAMIAEP